MKYKNSFVAQQYFITFINVLTYDVLIYEAGSSGIRKGVYVRMKEHFEYGKKHNA